MAGEFWQTVQLSQGKRKVSCGNAGVYVKGLVSIAGEPCAGQEEEEGAAQV